MFKLFLFLLASILLSAGCGQKSTIKNDVKSQRLADLYGNGKYMVRNLTFALSDNSLAYDSPDLGSGGPIIGGVMKFVGDVFAKNTGMGKMQMSYTQPLPQIPDELHGVRLTRVFFYIKPEGNKRRIRHWLSRVFVGIGSVTFDFLDKFAVRMSSTLLPDPDNYVPTFVIENYNRDEMATLMEAFTLKRFPTIIDNERTKEIILIKYDKMDKTGSISRKYGQIHVLQTANPQGTKHFFLNNAEFKGQYKRILILKDSLLIELKNNTESDTAFAEFIRDNNDEIERLGVTTIDTCTPRSCLELNIPDVNLVPIARKGNAALLEGIVHAAKVPESFNLEGFLEFELEIDSPI